MTVHISSIGNHKNWSEYFKMLPKCSQDVYCNPKYYSLVEKNTSGIAECFIYSECEDFIMYPFIKSSLKNLTFLRGFESNKFDIEGAYGYNGAFSTTRDARFISNFCDHFEEYCNESGVIAEFTRFNPILENHVFFKNHDVILANDNVVLDLSSEDIFYGEYEHSARKNIKKATRLGVSVKVVQGNMISKQELNSFLKVFNHTLTRNRAETGYFYPLEYFENISRSLGDSSSFFFAILGGEVISVELVLHGREIAYSFLGGTDSNYYSSSPNPLLKHEIIKHFKNRGLKFFCLGGGYSRKDGIFKYKKSFAKSGVIDFYIGKRTYDSETYMRVIEKWENAFPNLVERNKNILLRYRLFE